MPHSDRCLDFGLNRVLSLKPAKGQVAIAHIHTLVFLSLKMATYVGNHALVVCLVGYSHTVRYAICQG